ncbi:hypothetical protein D3C87_1936900 [compost metagenome]
MEWKNGQFDGKGDHEAGHQPESRFKGDYSINQFKIAECISAGVVAVDEIQAQYGQEHQ